jgi:hypothetical protein
MKTKWTESRLHNLYEHYNRKYWKARLTQFKVRIRSLDVAIGQCSKKSRLIEIDVEQHRSDAQIRSTLLHEMCHAAASKYGHGSSFCTQLEMLLRLKAPITIGFPEILKPFTFTIPKEFRCVRRAFRTIEEKQQREIQKITGKLPPINFKAFALFNIQDYALQGFTWKQIINSIGNEYHLLDIDNKPLPIFRKFFEKARKTYVKARREYLLEEGLIEAFMKNQKDSSESKILKHKGE